MRLSIGASFAWKQDDKARGHAISGEKASFKGLRSTERSLWSRVSDSNTLDTSDLRIWKSDRSAICMPLRATWCLPLSPLSLNLRLHLVDFLIQPEMKMQQAFWTFLSEAQRSSMGTFLLFHVFSAFTLTSSEGLTLWRSENNLHQKNPSLVESALVSNLALQLLQVACGIS